MILINDINNLDSLYDIVIVGGGPAGLSTAIGLSKLESRDTKILLIDAGKEIVERDRKNAEDVVKGIGGAGLFSDGKFSFYPSSSRLWSFLGKQELLRNAYHQTIELIQQQGTPYIPEFPNDLELNCNTSSLWTLKEYPSIYLTPFQREQLTLQMQNQADRVYYLTNTFIKNWKRNNEKINNFRIDLENSIREEISITCNIVIFANGRYGPLFLSGTEIRPDLNYQRLEFGVRIVQDVANGSTFFLDDNECNHLLDPKFKYHDEQIEWRTFCTCREGEVLLTHSDSIWSLSGRADCPSASGQSNVGFNTRILNAELGMSIMVDLLPKLSNNECFFKISLDSIENNDILDSIYGPIGKKCLIRGLKLLVEKFPSLESKKTFIMGPTLEGIGMYPILDSNLKMTSIDNCWIVGDATGIFRGIVSAMISGFYASLVIKNQIESKMAPA